MDVTLKRPQTLSQDDRAAWQSFCKANIALAGPCFSLEFLDLIGQVRADTRVICIYDHGAPIGFLPLHLGFAGHARPLGGPIGDFCAIITQGHADFNLTELLAEAGISAFDFKSALASQRCFVPHSHEVEGSWTIDLSDGFERYFECGKALNKKDFKQIERSHDKIQKAGGIFRVNDNREHILKTAMEWKSEQYRRSRYFDVFSVDWTQAFIKRLMTIQSENFSGLMSSLEIDGQLATAHFGMRTSSVMHHWFTVYNRDFSNLGPGVALLMEDARILSQDGIKYIDMGPGDYKYKRSLSSWQYPIVYGCAGTGPTYWARKAAQNLEKGFEQLPLGGMSQLPGRVFRKIDEYASYHPIAS